MVMNKTSLTELTKEQKEFAAENHYIVENFLKYRRLSRRKYYGLMIRAFIRAVKRYFMRPELWVYNFSAIALYSMKSVLYVHRRQYENRSINYTDAQDERYGVILERYS